MPVSRESILAATVVPSVVKQCAVCHGGKEGRLLGTIVYEIPVK